MKRLISGALTVALIAAGAVLLIGATEGSAGAAIVATKYAMQADAYGSRIKGGQVPAGSDMTAYKIIGCTNKAGISKVNHVAGSNLGGNGNLGVVTTRLWNTKVGDTVAINANNSVASVTLGNQAGSITIKGIQAYARAWHDTKGFHATAETTVAKILFTPPGGGPQEIPIPAPGQPIAIPGLATLTIGDAVHRTSATGAVARANTIKLEIPGSATKINIAHAIARIGGGVGLALFSGGSWASKANAVAGNVTSGQAPYQPFPCQGTGGKILTNNTVGVNLGGQIVVGAATASVQADQDAGKAWAIGKATVASINLGGGQLVIKGIVGRVEVVRTTTKITSTFAGSTVGSITANGSPQTFPDTGVLEIPGVAKLERNVVTKTNIGMKVIALRITLLDGSGAVIELGNADVKVMRSGL